ncbi:MAG: sugar isomerase domain-containing protein [Streptosporangiales bacterium]|nr:sugar isomerase domain-containing protein [Streptosporangiales bacterium]
MTVSAERYVAAMREVVDGVVVAAETDVHEAADLIATALRRGGVVQSFGTGHSQGIAMEIAGRAGGLVPTNRLSPADVVLFGGEEPEVLLERTLERDPELANRLYAITPSRPEDVFVLASSSGVNGCVVELALLAKKHGHPVIAITSLEHTRQVESRHPSGRRLAEVADVVLDNGAPYGDAILPLPAGGGAACAISSITGALLVQMVVAEVLCRLLDAGEDPPLYLSTNVTGGDEHNESLEARYAGRIRRTA